MNQTWTASDPQIAFFSERAFHQDVGTDRRGISFVVYGFRLRVRPTGVLKDLFDLDFEEPRERHGVR